MACCGHGPFFGFGLFLLILGFLLDVGGVASPYWVQSSLNGNQLHMGLWQICTSGQISGCTDIGNSADWFKVVRAFGLMGNALLLFAVIFALLRISATCKTRSAVSIITVLLALTSAVCNIVSVAVFAGKYLDFVIDTMDANFHFSFVFCVLSVVMAGVAGLFMIIEMRKTSSYSPI